MRHPIPEIVKVGAHTYRVESRYAKAMKEYMGDTDDDQLIIRLRKGMRRCKSQEILLHEILHAALYAKLHAEQLSEEDFVRTLAPIMVQVLQDNPALVAYLVNS